MNKDIQTESLRVINVSIRDEYRRYVDNPVVFIEAKGADRIFPQKRNGYDYVFELKEAEFTGLTLVVTHPDYVTRKVGIEPDAQEIMVYMGKPGNLSYLEEDTKIFFTPFPGRLAILFKPGLGLLHRSETETWLDGFELKWDDDFYKEAEQHLQEKPIWHCVVVTRKNRKEFNQRNSNELACLRNHELVLQAGPLTGYRGMLTNSIHVQWTGPDPGEVIQLLENKGFQIETLAGEIRAEAPKGTGLKILDLAEELRSEKNIRRAEIQRESLFSVDDTDPEHR